MGKFLLTMALMILLFLLAGTIGTPDNALFWFASSSLAFQLVRGVLSVVLIVQIFTQPPRHIWFRLSAGLLAVGVTVWAIQSSYSFTMPILDTFAFLAASVAIGVTALERKYDFSDTTSSTVET